MNNNIQSKDKLAPDKNKRFQLIRYFTILSMIAFILVAVSLVFFYRRVATNELLEIGESKNVALTQTFSNSIWPGYASYLSSVSNLSADEIRVQPETNQLRLAVLEQMNGLSVIKVKIYNLEGITVFSTQESQIGEDKSENEGFLIALNGGLASELTHRDTFSAFEGEIEDRDVISSYIPIQRGDSGVEGIFEVYDDVTPLLDSISIAQRNIAIGVTLILLLLYITLLLLVRRADNLIKQQYIEQQQAEEKIQNAYNELNLRGRKEERVNEFFRITLTHMVDMANRGADKAELLIYIEQIKQQFSALS